MLYYYYSVRQYVLSLLTNELLNRVGWCLFTLQYYEVSSLLYYYYSVRQYVLSPLLLRSSDVPIVLMAVDCTRLKIELPYRVWWCLFTLQYHYASDW